jgi:tRNA A-37 threonylcarbamoyl transferase component Bud32
MTLTTEPGTAVQASDESREQASEQTSPPGTSASQRLVMGRYRLIEPLGRGGMGRVYRAHDDLLDRPVAVKLIYDDAVSDRDLRRACAVEARAAARLSHPGVVRILDSGFDDGHCFVVMELAEGQTLSQLIRESGWLPVERALGLAAQIADALEEAHRQGVVHCDVKPGNLIVDRYERIRLVDFGIARVSNSSTGLSDQDIHGSAKYVAPEQVEGGKIDARTDLYALGVVLFEMLTGRPPFTGGNLASILAQRLVADPPSVRGLQATVPLDVDQIVRKAMAREPDERYQSAGELRDALRSAREMLVDTDRLPLREVVPVASRRAAESAMPGLQTASLSQRTALVGSGIAKGAATVSLHTATVARHALPWLARMLRLIGERLTRAGRLLGDRASAILPGPAQARQLRWPSLPVAIGMVALLGLLSGVAAAQCGMVAATAEETASVRPVEAATEPLAAPAPAEQAIAPTEAPTVAPVVAPTEPPPPAPTAAEPPPATASAPAPEPPAAAAPVQPAPVRAAPAAPVQALRAPVAAPAAEPEPEAGAPSSDLPADAAIIDARAAEEAKRRSEAEKHPGQSEQKPPAAKPEASQAPDPQPAAPKPIAKPEVPGPNEPRSAQQPPAPQQAAPQPAAKPAPGNGQGSNGNGNGQGNGNGNGNSKKR